MTISYNHTTLKLFINKGLDNCYLLAILLLMYEFVYEKKSKKIYKMENLNFFIVIDKVVLSPLLDVPHSPSI